MTDSDWLAFGSPTELCGELLLVAQPRKLFLLTVQMLRRVESLLPTSSILAVEALADYTHSRASIEEVGDRFVHAWEESGDSLWLGQQSYLQYQHGYWLTFDDRFPEGNLSACEALHDPAWLAAQASFYAARLEAFAREDPLNRSPENPATYGVASPEGVTPYDSFFCSERRAQFLLYVDIVGNPLTGVCAAPESLRNHPDVRALLRQMTQQELLNPTMLAILGDALEEAGCTEEAVLQHCRSQGPHFVGCWALEWLTGRAALKLSTSGPIDLWANPWFSR